MTHRSELARGEVMGQISVSARLRPSVRFRLKRNLSQELRYVDCDSFIRVSEKSQGQMEQ